MLLKTWPENHIIYEEVLGSEGLFWTLATGMLFALGRFVLLIIFI